MRIPKLAIENHQFTIVIVILLVMFGLVALLTMPRSEDPQVTPAGSSVVVIYPGANPADLEEMVIDPIEEVINELDDIKKLNSNAGDGLAVVAVEFESGSDPDDKYSDVVQKVNSIRDDLPENIFDLKITKWSITDVNIFQIALISDTKSYRDLNRLAENLKRDLEKIAGVKRSETHAIPEEEVRIELDFEKIAQMNIPVNNVIQAIQSANQNIPGGSIKIGNKKFNVKTSGTFQTLQDIENLIIHSAQGKIVFLKDVAQIDFNYEDIKYKARVNQQRAVYITVTQKQGTNIFNLEKDVKSHLEDFKKSLPEEIKISVVFDQSRSVAERVSGFFSNLLQGLLLVGLVVFLAVNVRASFIVILVIPLSIITGLGFVDLSGYGIQQMTIAGFVIALGLLVDNAIVVTDNITRFMRAGKSKFESAVEGTTQIAWAIGSSTLTTVLAFIPMMLLPDVTGDFIRSMPVTVVITLFASLFFALTVTPYLSFRFLKPFNGKKYIRRKMDTFIESRYKNILTYAISRPKTVISISLMIFALSLALFPLVGVSFFPKAEKPQFIVNVNTPDGSSLDKTDEVAEFVEKRIMQIPETKYVVSNIGKGNPRIYYNVIQSNENNSHAQIFVQLEELDLKRFDEIIKNLRADLGNTAGVKIEVKEFEQGPPVEAPIAIRILGDDLSILKIIAADVEKMIRTTEGTVNINNPESTAKMDLHVKINRNKAAMLGVPLVEIDRTVRAAVNGLSISKFRDKEGKEYDIIVRLPATNSESVGAFGKIYVASYTGTIIPLKQLAQIEFKSTPMSIDHYFMERNITLTADVVGDMSVNELTQKIIKKLDAYNWPEGFRYSVGGELESRQESFGGLSQAVLVALIGIFAVLVLQFRSFSQPLIVFSAIPLAIIGSIIALLITGNSFSFTAFVGLTSLVGIVVNNSIILVDYSNQLYRKSKDLVLSITEAASTRFVPIILTTATTIGGLLPLTLRGGTMWAPMGWTIIGGLIASTFLTLILVPALYKVFTK